MPQPALPSPETCEQARRSRDPRFDGPAGFGSLRRFNATFQDAYRMAPRDLRHHPRSACGTAGAERSRTGDTLSLRLGYRPPHDFAAMLDFLRGRALPGVERVDADSYARVIAGTDGAPGWLRVSRWPGEHALRLDVHAPLASRLLDIVQRLRRMFDLDADPHAIQASLSADPRLAPLLAVRPGLRLPGAWDGFEIAVRAVLGQQVSVAAARTLATRLSQRFGMQLAEPFCEGLDHLFPTPEALLAADLQSIGLTRARAATVRAMAAAVLGGQVDFRPERPLDDFTARWVALPGIGPWTAQYIAMRARGHQDAFPAGDLVLRKALAGDGGTLSEKAVSARAEAWRPWRAYAAIHLWTNASGGTP